MVEAAITGALDYKRLNTKLPDDLLKERLVLGFLERRRIGEVSMAGLGSNPTEKGRAVLADMMMKSMLPWMEGGQVKIKGFGDMSMTEIREAYKQSTGATDEMIDRINKPKV